MEFLVLHIIKMENLFPLVVFIQFGFLFFVGGTQLLKTLVMLAATELPDVWKCYFLSEL